MADEHIEEVPLNQVEGNLKRLSQRDLRWLIRSRIAMNLAHTGHPFHHKTADGTIVDADPTLEEAIASLKDVLPAVPVNRNFYGVDLYSDDRAKRMLDH